MPRIVKLMPTFLVAIIVVTAAGRREASATDAQSAIKALETGLSEAVAAKDLDRVMSYYTVSDDLVVFDATPPLQFTGWQAYKEQWKRGLDGCKDNPSIEITRLVTYGGAGYAFSHSIQHFTCTNPQGGKVDLTFRVTDGYANFKGKWLIAHEHVSVPVDLSTGKADLQAKP